jgi:EpsI family protein
VVARSIVISIAIIATALMLERASGAESVPPRAPLQSLPLSLDGWSGRDLPPWDDKILNELGADDYVNRRYFSATSVADLYVGFYRSQQQGDSIHSPQNCLPGAGWQPVSSGRVDIPVAERGSIPVNRYVIQKDLDRQVVLYWFQGRGRVVANEYANRAYLVFDSLRMRRSDGALVRVISPVLTTPGEAEEGVVSFAAALYPHLAKAIP